MLRKTEELQYDGGAEKSLISGRGQSWLKIVLDVQGARIRVGAWQLPHISSLEAAFKDVLQNRDFFPMAS